MKRDKRVVIVGVVFVVAVLAVLIYSTLGLRKYRVEVCMAFQGRTDCRVASGTTRAEAVRTASENACALIASGMTDSINCGHSTPISIKELQ